MSPSMFMRRLAGTLLVFGAFLLSVVHAAGPATSVVISPTSATLNSDQTQTFIVTATDADGQTRDVTAETTFSANDPLGSITGATYHAGREGTWSVQGVYQSFTVTATMTVTPGAVHEVVVNPNSDPELVNLGSKKTFTAAGYDAASNEVSDFTPTWTVIGEIGTIDAKGVFTAKKAGTGKIQASAGTIIGEVAVSVKQPAVESTANANTNAVAPTVNRNANANGNVNAANTNAAVSNTNSDDPASNGIECKTLSNWLWIVILIAFLIGVAILYALVPVTKVWPAVIGLGGAIALVAIQRAYGCDILGWWSWVLALGTLAMTVFALRQLPAPKPPIK